MAGKGDQTAADWLDQVFEQLRALTDQAIAVVAAAAPPTDAAEAEKRARAIGVLARTAKAVAVLAAAPARKARDPEEDGMSEDDRELSDGEEQAVRAELESRLDHLLGVAERKGFGQAAPGGGAARGAAAAAEDDAEADRRPGLAV